MISWTITCCLIGLGAGSHSQVLEPFRYSTDAEAQCVWRAVAERGQEPRLHVHDTDEGKVLELALPFADQPHISRVFIDRDVAMNLAAAGGFELDVESYPPTAGARLSLYFRSGDGWYAGGGE